MILSTPLLFSIPPPSTTPILNPNPSFSSSLPPARSRRRNCRRCRCRPTGDSQWDSNAESFRFRFRDEGDEDGEFRESGGSSRRWWSDEPADEYDDEFDPFGEDSESFWDKFWIFKVFKAYGYMLPAIIASLLLATGPKAFLLALALPLGQSAISLAVEKLWGKVAEGPRTKPKTKRKPFARSSSNFRKQGKEERSSGGRGRSGGYQSWASADSGATNRVGDSRRSSFGGWDDLDSQKGSMRRESPTTGGSPQTEMPKRGTTAWWVVTPPAPHHRPGQATMTTYTRDEFYAYAELASAHIISPFLYEQYLQIGNYFS